MPHIRSQLHAKTAGFTLIELLITLALMGILAAWGLPNFQALGERSAVASEVNRLQTALTLARNTAITQRGDATLCPINSDRSACLSGTDDWSGELVVFAGKPSESIPTQDIVRFFPATSGATSISKTNASISYLYYTYLGRVGYGARTLDICPANESTQTSGKSLVINPPGRARVDEDPISCAD
ncbi:GspH/FimT family pseudopilin [Halomonas sp. 7T]|uniref:GspH/FimT family pseudopilin n=1 Tax=Halomonas sp. 7T TaxID=2893469 RepID=UPI0021D8DF87|nr:GspH/FimT family pseudopilin [Halomonas sp. 7T]UXZ53585.1 GspH/FimT family pseudopilin [Halomonas sp. 7T]